MPLKCFKISNWWQAKGRERDQRGLIYHHHTSKHIDLILHVLCWSDDKHQWTLLTGDVHFKGQGVGVAYVQPEELPVSSKSMLPMCRTPATTRNRSSFSVSSRPIFFMATHVLLKSPWSSRRGSFSAPTCRCCNNMTGWETGNKK